MRYGEVSPSHAEYFASGALRPTGDTWVDLDHDGERIVGWLGAGLEVDAGAEEVRFRLDAPRTPAGDAALAGIRDGSRAGVSIEFSSVREDRDSRLGLRRVQDALLHGFGLVPEPSYPSATAEARRRSSGFTVRARAPLGKRLPCRCKTGCQTIRMQRRSLDKALARAEAGEIDIIAFVTGKFSEPVGSTGGGSLLLRRRGDALDVELDLAANDAGRSFLESKDDGFWTVRPWAPEETSAAEVAGDLYDVSEMDLRAIEIALVTGPKDGFEPLRIVENRKRRRRVWL